MRTYLLSVILFVAVAHSAIGQVAYDLKTAKALALDQNKLIIVDFWATWCKPCRTMEAKLWSSPEFSALKDRFVLLKIDIDSNKDIATKYYVKAIPAVYVITANGDRIWKEQGFRDAKSYLDIFSSFPKDYTALNRHLLKLFDKKEGRSEQLFGVGEAFQQLGSQTDHNKVKRAFLSLSDSYFKKVQKNADSNSLELESLLAQLLNDAYRGSHKKAIKQLDNIRIEDDLEKAKEFKDFVLAYCYKCEGDTEKSEAIKKRIKDKTLRSRLD